MRCPPNVRLRPVARCRRSLGHEPDLGVRAVAIRLVGGVAAAAQPRIRHAVQGPAGARHQLHIARHVQRAVVGRLDLQGPLRWASGSDGVVAGSPVATKPLVAWLPSQ